MAYTGTSFYNFQVIQNYADPAKHTHIENIEKGSYQNNKSYLRTGEFLISWTCHVRQLITLWFVRSPLRTKYSKLRAYRMNLYFSWGSAKTTWMRFPRSDGTSMIWTICIIGRQIGSSFTIRFKAPGVRAGPL